MLSDEEKEAIEWLKRLVKLNKRDNLDDTFAEILLNLIEKQSKEIKELNKSDASKEQSSMKYYNLYRELVDKIKAKIEEYRHKDFIKMQVVWKHDKEALKIVEVLQSLLEKEFPTTITKEDLEKRWKE